jgi:hypothetical protein
LDDIVLHSFNRLDQRLHRVPRGRRADPLATRIRGDISNTAFCSEQADRLVRYIPHACHRATRAAGWILVGRDEKVACNGIPIRVVNLVLGPDEYED